MSSESIMLVTFVGIILFVCLLVAFIAIILFLHQKKQQAFIVQMEELKDSLEQEILKTKLEVQEETFRHVARDIHDNIGQYLTLAKLHLNTVSTDGGELSQKKISSAVELLTKSIEDMRDLSRSLTQDLIQTAGLQVAVEQQVEQLKSASNYQIDYRMFGVYQFLDEHKEIIVLRILQEAINNIIRHSKANWVRICLECTPLLLTLTVEDDGKGFVLNSPSENRSMNRRGGGLTNMRARAEIINANFIVESQPDRGTIVKVSVPLTPQETNN